MLVFTKKVIVLLLLLLLYLLLGLHLKLSYLIDSE
jgi:hypothetical protein